MKVLHVDANNFFASVAIKNNPNLEGKPLIICGDPEKRHGIVLAKSNEAKKMGIKTTQTIAEAKKLCKNLICLPPDFKQYAFFSDKLFEIYKRYTPLVEKFGMDECWLDVTGSEKLFGEPIKIADSIRETVKKELGITVSVGVSFTKTFAKLGSDLKKPDAVTVIDENNFKKVAWKLPVSEMIYIGDAAKSKLMSLKIKTIGDLANAPLDILIESFGKSGQKMHEYANGTDGERVEEYYSEHIPDSISNGTTCSEDIISERSARSVVYSLSEMVAFRMRKHGLLASGVSVNVKNSDFRSVSKQTKLPSATADAGIIAKTAIKGLLSGFSVSEDNPIRTITVGVYGLSPEKILTQDCFFMTDEERHSVINKKLDGIRGKYGYSILKKAIELDDTFVREYEKVDKKPD